MNNQGNITPPKETNNTLMTSPKEMEVNEQSGKELKIILLKKISELQKKKKRNYMTLGKQCMNILRSSRKRIEIDLKIKTKVLELKKIMIELHI